MKRGTTIDEVIRGEKPWEGTVLCPFHDDHTPSARLYPGGSFHCFVCDAHAHSRFDVVRQLHFPNATYQTGILLAKSFLNTFGYVVGEAQEPTRRPGPSSSTIDAMTIYRRLASNKLSQEKDIVRHLQDTRGLKDPVGVGIGISDKSLIDGVRTEMRECYDKDEIQEALVHAGLLNEKGHERLSYPHYRFVIPEIREDKTVYYQARASADQLPKYINPALPKPLFGLSSLETDSRFVVVSEGPFDVLPLIEDGAAAVAVLGSSGLDELDSPVFKKRPIVVGFDGDVVGMKKGAQVTELLRALGCQATHIPPPKAYKDYGQWVTAVGPGEVLATLEWGLD